MHMENNSDHINFEYAKPLYTSAINWNFKTENFIFVKRLKKTQLESYLPL
jgi:hypothetical protein